MKKDFLTVAQGGFFSLKVKGQPRMNWRGGQRSNWETSSPSCRTSVITPCVILRLLVDSLGGWLSYGVCDVHACGGNSCCRSSGTPPSLSCLQMRRSSLTFHTPVRVLIPLSSSHCSLSYFRGYFCCLDLSQNISEPSNVLNYKSNRGCDNEKEAALRVTHSRHLHHHTHLLFFLCPCLQTVSQKRIAV